MLGFHVIIGGVGRRILVIHSFPFGKNFRQTQKLKDLTKPLSFKIISWNFPNDSSHHTTPLCNKWLARPEVVVLVTGICPATAQSQNPLSSASRAAIGAAIRFL
jgi:hypothetical protein